MKWGLIGEFAGHSLPPVIHEEFFGKPGIHGTRTLMEISRERFAAWFIRSLSQQGPAFSGRAL